ncbi:MAG: CsbD family protein [Corynebacterium sp.]|nr:CsbD family protein [Corynebacterium sp.]
MGDLENKAEDFAGKAKEAVGGATDNDDLKNEGKADQVKSDVKDAVSDAGDKIKDVANDVLGKFKKD